MYPAQQERAVAAIKAIADHVVSDWGGQNVIADWLCTQALAGQSEIDVPLATGGRGAVDVKRVERPVGPHTLFGRFKEDGLERTTAAFVTEVRGRWGQDAAADGGRAARWPHGHFARRYEAFTRQWELATNCSFGTCPKCGRAATPQHLLKEKHFDLVDKGGELVPIPNFGGGDGEAAEVPQKAPRRRPPVHLPRPGQGRGRAADRKGDQKPARHVAAEPLGEPFLPGGIFRQPG
jgi:hypothetical protein